MKKQVREYVVIYTKDKLKSLDDAFASFQFVVYNEKDLEEVMKNIEEHFDGVVICADNREDEHDNTHFGRGTRKKTKRKHRT